MRTGQFNVHSLGILHVNDPVLIQLERREIEPLHIKVDGLIQLCASLRRCCSTDGRRLEMCVVLMPRREAVNLWLLPEGYTLSCGRLCCMNRGIIPRVGPVNDRRRRLDRIELCSS